MRLCGSLRCDKCAGPSLSSIMTYCNGNHVSFLQNLGLNARTVSTMDSRSGVVTVSQQQWLYSLKAGACYKALAIDRLNVHAGNR